MQEKILQLVKFLYLNFDYFLIFAFVIIWLLFRKRSTSFIHKNTIKFGNFLYNSFIKLTKIKVVNLLIIFFVINVIIRLFMALPAAEIAVSQDKLAPHYLNLARSMYQGEGFTTHVIWNNFLEHSKITRPDFFRTPLYPFMIFLSYKIFGNSFFSAELVNVLAGSLLPIFAFLFSFGLTKSKKIATLLLILISFNSLILTWVVITYPEILYACCALLFFYFLHKTKDKINFSSILVGVFWALTYLTRAEALYIFLPVTLFYFFYKQNKKQFLIKFALSIFGFLIIASPYLARNYAITKDPFFSDFDRILMVAYVDNERLIESPNVEYKNIYDLALKNPVQITTRIIKKIFIGIISIPILLLSSYAITLFMLVGLFYVWKKNRQKYYFLFLAMLLAFLLPTVIIFTDRYYIFLIILFYLFVSIGFFKLTIYNLKDNHFLRSILTIYLTFFIAFGGLVGIGTGSVPYIPHSFYKDHDANIFYSDLQNLYDYIKTNTQKDDVIMVSRQPYGIHYNTERQIVIFPFTDKNGVDEFIKKYNVKWLISMGSREKIDGKYVNFFLTEEIPNNIKSVLKNSVAELFKVEDNIN